MASGFKAIIVTDLEGVAGVVNPVVWNSADTSGAFDEYTRLLVGEVNAAVAACFDSGAEEVLIVEGHRNSFRGRLSEFDSRAKVALGVPFHKLAEGRHDALLLVGYHAMSDADAAVLSHSHSSGTYVATWLNGTLIGEIGHLAALFGEYGTPLVFVSGDAAACKEADELVDGVVTAPVKQGVHRFAAITLSPAAACELIRESAAEAVAGRDEIRPLGFEPPVEFVVEFATTDPVERNTLIPGIETAGPRRMLIRGKSVAEVMERFWLTSRLV